jgi:hypothetical protein
MRSLAAGFSLALLCSIAALVHDRTATAGDLFDFRSDSGRFRIEFPAMAPESRNLSAAKFTSTTNNIVHEVRVGETSFAVELHDIPRVAAMLLTRDYILERAKEGMLADMGARELSSRKVSRQQHPARRVRYEVPEQGLEGELLIVLVRRRLYLVSAQYPTQSKPPVMFSTFVDSFEFWLE